MSEATDVWTTRRLMGWMSEHFRARGLDSPRVVAERLLAHVLNCPRMRLYMEVDRPASEAELARLRDLVKRASSNEPLQYLVGTETFHLREFEVDPCTLIPRPCTETLVEFVLDDWRSRHPGARAGGRRDEVLPWSTVEPRGGASVGSTSTGATGSAGAAGTAGEEPGGAAASNEDEEAEPDADPPYLIADLGTGTGCIGVSLAASIPGATVVATDVTEEILDLARRNASRHGVAGRVEFRLGPTWEPFGEGERFDYVVSNPPYVPDEEWETAVGANVKGHEPERALRGGPGGLDVLRPLIEGAADRLRPGGWLVCEIPARQADRVLEIVRARPGLTDARVLRDQDDLPRVMVARRGS